MLSLHEVMWSLSWKILDFSRLQSNECTTNWKKMYHEDDTQSGSLHGNKTRARGVRPTVRLKSTLNLKTGRGAPWSERVTRPSVTAAGFDRSKASGHPAAHARGSGPRSRRLAVPEARRPAPAPAPRSSAGRGAEGKAGEEPAACGRATG